MGCPILFGTGEEQRHAQSGCESGHVRHPRVWLRHNPLRSDVIGKGIAGDDEFGCDDPGRAESRGSVDGLLNKPAVLCDVPGDRREMEQRDA